MRAVALEFAKMHRLRQVPILLAAVGAVVLFTTMTLAAASARTRFADPAAQPWEQLLMQYAATVAMLFPILLAVLASRQADLEHQGRGWSHAQAAGVSAATLLRAKVVALGLVLVVMWTAQTVLVLAIGRLAGIVVRLPFADWLAYGVRGLAVSLAILALSVWLAARFDNQLIVLGVGVLGGFLGFYCLLFPPWVSALIPWGYFALASPYRMDGSTLLGGQTMGSTAALAGFLLVTAAGFWWVSTCIDGQVG